MLHKTLAAWILSAAALSAQTIEGHVVNSVTGVGIPDVAVDIFRDFGKVFAASTDLQGRFRIEGVPDGAYTVFYKAPNYQPARPGGGQFKVVKGAPVRLEAAMIQTGKLSGRVLDGAGKPLPKATIQLDHEIDNGGFRQVTDANEKGEYSVEVQPGAWTVAATAPSSWPPPESPKNALGVSSDIERLGWAQTFYPGVTRPEFAAKIDVPPGGEVSKLDIKLAAVPVHRIRGAVLDLHGDPVPKLSVTLGAGAFAAPRHQDTKAGDGTFEFASVTDGDWDLSAVVNRDGVKLWAHQKIQVKGRDSENIELRLTPPFSIQGKIVMEVPEGMPAPKPPSVMVELAGPQAAFADRVNVGGLFNPDAKGDFTVTNIYPGPYQILPGFLPPPLTPPYYLDSIRLGERDALEPSVQIESGALPIIVTYKQNGGTVRGSVEACGAGEILLIPQDSALRRDGFIHKAACTQNRFEIPAVRPGEYYGFALAPDAPAEVRRKLHKLRPELDQNLINQAVRVSVRANEATLADLRLF